MVADHARLINVQRFYKLQEELPTHYDLVINTDVLTGAQAATMVLAAVQTLA